MDECRHVKLLEVFGEILRGERLSAVDGVLVTRPHPVQPERVDHPLRNLDAKPAATEEWAAGDPCRTTN